MTDDIFDKGLALLTETFGNLKQALTTQRLKVWRTLLTDLPDEDFMNAIVVICQTQKEFYPGTNIIATIREAAKTCQEAEPLPEEVWSGIKKGARFGTDHLPEWFRSDDVVNQTIEAIGWNNILWMTPETEPYVRTSFLKIYTAFKNQEEAYEVRELVAEFRIENEKLLQIEN